MSCGLWRSSEPRKAGHNWQATSKNTKIHKYLSTSRSTLYIRLALRKVVHAHTQIPPFLCNSIYFWSYRFSQLFPPNPEPHNHDFTTLPLSLPISHRPANPNDDVQYPIVKRIVATATMSSPSLNKIAANSPSRQNPSELEQNIAGALYDLETNTADLKVALRPLQFVSAREVR